MAGLAEALRDIHRVGVVHRDLKPSNVLLAEDGPKVIDFGISRPKDSELRTETGKLIGTPPFMAPEQFRRPREVGPAADIFALGSVMVHAATGRGPFDSDSPYVVAYQVVHDEPDLTGVPENLAPLIVRCLAKEPEDRPTPDELMRELRSVAASYDTQAFIPAQRATQEPPAPEAGRRPSRSRTGTGWRGEGRTAAGRRRRRLAVGAGTARSRRGRRTGLRATSRRCRPVARAHGPRTTSAAFSAWATPAPKKGTPLCSHGEGKVVCSQSGLVFALDPLDGRLLWRHPVDTSQASGPPTVAGGLVHPWSGQWPTAGGARPGHGQGALAAERARGQRVGDRRRTCCCSPAPTARSPAWTALRVTRSGAVPYRVSQAPNIVSFAGDPLAYTATTSVDGSSTRVTALDPATGDVRWDARLKGTLKPIGASDGSVFFVSVEGIYSDAQAMVRYSPADRTSRRVPLPVPLPHAHGAVRGNVAYLEGGDGQLIAVDMEARKQLWSLETEMLRTSSPVTDGRHVYVTAPDGRLLAVDARDGRLVGQTLPRLGASSGQVASDLPEPVLADGRVYAAASDGTVFAVDARDPSAW